MVIHVWNKIIYLLLYVIYLNPVNFRVYSEPTDEESSVNHLNLKRNLLANSAPKCSVTGEEYKFPWWRVELEEEVLVNEVVILSASEEIASQLHDLIIRVGNVDINSISGGEIFSQNLVCNEIPNVPSITSLEIFCNSSVAGKFVSIQITEPCNFPGCFGREENLLTLCEVQIFGVKLKDLKSESSMSWLKKDSPNQITVKQSSTAFGGIANYALRPRMRGELITSFSEDICFQFLAIDKNASFNTALNNIYVINEIRINPTKDNIYDNQYKIQVLISSSRFSTDHHQYELCGNYEGYLQKNKVINIKCQKPIMGRYVSITVQHIIATRNDDELNIFNGCQIEIFGNKVINLARFKPTASSSSFGLEEDSSFGIDGKVHPQDFIYDGGKRLRNVLTKDDDPYPWWKVDLLTSHLVKKVLIYRTFKVVMQNFVIRVGSEDLPKNFRSTIFEENLICKDFSNSSITDNTIQITCDFTLFGRYVTIQVVNYCNDSSCEEDQYINILSFTEFEVYGIPIDIYHYGNIALEYPVERSQDRINCATTSELSDINRITYHWWKLETQEAVVVEEINLFIAKNIDRKKTYRIQIWISNTDVSSQVDAEWITDNHICFASEAFQFTKNFYTFPCKQLIGKFIFVQYNQTEPNINTSCHDVLFTDVSVWAYKIKSNYLVIGNKDNTEWRENMESVAVEQIDRVRNEEFNVQCTYTAPGLHPYPWWKMKLDSIYNITRILIRNTEDEFHRRLHDIEIRVGFEDIEESSFFQPFSSNSLCISKGYEPLQRGITYFDCRYPVIGNYITVQIVKPCNNPTKCNITEPNILHLCGFSIYGSKILNINSTGVNLALGASAQQSTTLGTAVASLALDGKY